MSEYGHNDSSRRWDGRSWSLALTEVREVQVRAHLSLVIFLAVVLLNWLGWLGVALAAAMILALGIHEAGHFAATQAMRGRVHQIVAWPLGNLRGPRIAHRPIETTLVHLAGPGANLVACLALLPALHWSGGLDAQIWNPLALDHVWHGPRDPASALGLAFKANYWLALANLLPMLPLDGGRVVRELFTVRFNDLQADLFARLLGMLVGLVVFSLGLWFHLIWVALIGGFCGYSCLRRQRELEFLADVQENEFGYDFSQGYTSLERSQGQGSAATPPLRLRFRLWLEERRRRRGRMLEIELDRILEKIHFSGIASLSRSERKILAEASRKRKP